MSQDPRKLGIGGAPTRATTFPKDAAGRKRRPVASGVLDYFPDALVAISEISLMGNEQHNAGQPLHWARGKSTDQDDTIIRHFLQRGLLDDDGVRHSAKMAWRALALLQLEIEAEQQAVADTYKLRQGVQSEIAVKRGLHVAELERFEDDARGNRK